MDPQLSTKKKWYAHLSRWQIILLQTQAAHVGSLSYQRSNESDFNLNGHMLINNYKFRLMDFFYKPPIERPDECEVLERNYMNCMLQKALKDRVYNNRCNMESILWFHLECPKHKDKFDDPVEFKIKWRDFFAQVHAGAKHIIDPDN